MSSFGFGKKHARTHSKTKDVLAIHHPIRQVYTLLCHVFHRRRSLSSSRVASAFYSEFWSVNRIQNVVIVFSIVHQSVECHLIASIITGKQRWQTCMVNARYVYRLLYDMAIVQYLLANNIGVHAQFLLFSHFA